MRYDFASFPRFLFVCSTILAAGCCLSHRTSSREPIVVAQEYTAALKGKDFRLAASLLDASVRPALDCDKVLERFSSRDAEKMEEVQSLFAADEPIRETKIVRLQVSNGSVISLILRDAGWFVYSGDLVPPASGSPRAALDDFLLTIDSGDCNAFARCAPPKVLQSTPHERIVSACKLKLEELRALAQSIRKAEGPLMQQSENVFVLPYGEFRKVILVRHGNRWFVQDI